MGEPCGHDKDTGQGLFHPSALPGAAVVRLSSFFRLSTNLAPVLEVIFTLLWEQQGDHTNPRKRHHSHASGGEGIV